MVIEIPNPLIFSLSAGTFLQFSINFPVCSRNTSLFDPIPSYSSSFLHGFEDRIILETKILNDCDNLVNIWALYYNIFTMLDKHRPDNEM